MRNTSPLYPNLKLFNIGIRMEIKSRKEQARIVFKAVKTPLGIGLLLLVVLGLLVFTPVEHIPVVISLIKALTQVILIGDLDVTL